MKLLSLGDNVFDAYLFRKELYPGGNAANVSVLARRAGAEAFPLRAGGGAGGSQPPSGGGGEDRL